MKDITYFLIIIIIIAFFILKRREEEGTIFISEEKGKALNIFIKDLESKGVVKKKDIDIDFIIKHDSDFSIEKMILILAMYDDGHLDNDPSTHELRVALKKIGYEKGVSLSQYASSLNLGKLSTLQKLITDITSTSRGTSLVV